MTHTSRTSEHKVNRAWRSCPSPVAWRGDSEWLYEGIREQRNFPLHPHAYDAFPDCVPWIQTEPNRRLIRVDISIAIIDQQQATTKPSTRYRTSFRSSLNKNIAPPSHPSAIMQTLLANLGLGRLLAAFGCYILLLSPHVASFYTGASGDFGKVRTRP